MISIKRSLELAELLKPLLLQSQIISKEFSIEELKNIIKDMRNNTSILRALPFPATQNKADINYKKIELFEAVINLMEKQKEVLTHKNNYIDDEMLKNLGLI